MQGVWAEGRMSMWGGDYHLNVNLQMQYWPADAVGLGPAVLPPLFAFLGKLRRAGEGAAKGMYGCKVCVDAI